MSSDTVEFVNRLLDEIAGLQYGRSYNMLTVAEREDVMRRACISRPTPSRMANDEAQAGVGARTDGQATPTRPQLVSNVTRAARMLQVRFDAFAQRIVSQEREHFFHPINRSNWINEFANWLHEDEASND